MAQIIIDKTTIADVADGYSLSQLHGDFETRIVFDCRDGTCGRCLVAIKAGGENLSAAEAKERALLQRIGAVSNERLACYCLVEHGVVEVETNS